MPDLRLDRVPPGTPVRITCVRTVGLSQPLREVLDAPHRRKRPTGETGV
jgi:hypothetical protein